MAYTTSTLSLASQPITDRKKWYYTSGDTQATVGASSYISDAAAKGMAAGDEMTQYISSLNSLVSYMVKTCRSSLTSGSADLTSGMSLSS